MPQTLEEKINTAKAAGYSQEEIDAFLNKNKPKETASTPISEVATKAEGIRPRNIKDTLRDLQPYISMAAGGVTGALTENPLAVSAAMAGTDYISNKFLNNQESYPISEALGITGEGKPPSGSPIFNAVASIGENTLANEGMGRLMTPLLRGPGNAAINVLKESDSGASTFLQRNLAKVRDKITSAFNQNGKGSVSGELSKFDPTFAQYLSSQDKHSTIADTIENMFAKKDKVKAIINSSEKVRNEADNFIKSLTGNKKLDLNSVDLISRNLQNKAQINYENLVNEIIDTEHALQLNPNDKALKKNLDQLLEAKTNFFPGRERGVGVKDLLPQHPSGFPQLGLSNTNAPTPIIGTILGDSQKVQRFLNTGEIKLGNRSITSASPRKDLAGEAFANIFNGVADTASGAIDTNSLKNKWNAYKISDAGRKLYNAQNRADIDKFIDLASHVSESVGDKGASKYLTLRLLTASAGLGGGLLTGIASGNAAAGLGVSGVIIGGSVGLHILGKLMTNPDTARLMISAVSGGPLNMAPKVAARMLARGLRGQPIQLQMKDDKGNVSNVDGKVNAQGKFEIAGKPGNEYSIK